MRKSEMSADQIENRNIVRNLLLGSGWIENENQKWFDQDAFVYYEASMCYDNKKISISVNYKADKNVLYMSIEDKLNNGLDLIIYFENNLDQLLKTIISFQDLISPNNYKKYIKKILEVTPVIYVSVGEDNEEIAPLLDDIDKLYLDDNSK